MLHRIEITGFDRSVETSELARLARAAKLPVEWGVVLQHSQIRNRPPPAGTTPAFRERNPDWEQILEAESLGLRLACHASGSRILEAILRGRVPDLRHPAGLRPFQALQLNLTTRAQPFESVVAGAARTYTSYVAFLGALLDDDALKIEDLLERLAPSVEIILQVLIGPRTEPVVHPALVALAERCIAAGRTTRLLLDTSGGRGAVDLDAWPGRAQLGERLASVPIGYAGGLRPDNLAAALDRIAPRLAPGERIWCGMESGVRRSVPHPTRAGKQLSQFDPEAVARVLEVCAPYVRAP